MNNKRFGAITAVLLMLVVALTPLSQSFWDSSGDPNDDDIGDEVFNVTTEEKESVSNVQSIENKQIIIVDYAYKDVMYTLYSDHTAMATGTEPIDDTKKTYKEVSSIESTVEYDGETFILTVIGSGKTLTGSFIDTKESPFVIPDTVQTIGTAAFSGKTFRSVLIGSGVTSIGNSAFNGCSSLREVKFSGESSLKYIGNEAFRGCLINTIDIPDSVETLGSQVFMEVWPDNGMTVKIGSGLQSIGLGAFGYVIETDTNTPGTPSSPNISEFIVSGNNIHYQSKDGVLYKIENGEKELLRYPSYSKLESFTVPNDVSSIGDYAFTGAMFLKNIEFEQGSIIQYIGDYSFHSLSIDKIVLPDTIRSIGSYCFQKAMITEITIPASCTRIGTYAFTNTPLNTLTLSNDGSVGLTIESYAFISLDNAKFKNKLSKVVFTDDCSIVSIGDKAFYSCPLSQFGTTKGSIEIPHSVESIGDNAFNPSSSATEISSKISSIIIKGNDARESKLIMMGEYAFKDAITGNVADGSDSVIGSVVGSVDLSACVLLETIPISAFESTKINGLSIEFPNNLVSIGNNAFNCSLNGSRVYEVTIPSSVEYIGMKAFYGSTKVSIEEGSNLKSLKKNVFGDGKDNDGKKIIVPYLDLSSCGSLEEMTYQQYVDKISLPPGSLLTSTEKINNKDYTYLQKTSKDESGSYTIIYSYDKDSKHNQLLTKIEITGSILAIPLDRITGPIDTIKDNSGNTNPYFEVSGGALYLKQYDSDGKVIGRTLVKVQSDVVSFIVPSDVNTIVGNAFSGCSVLDSIFISTPVSGVSDTAFKDCDATLYLSGQAVDDTEEYSQLASVKTGLVENNNLIFIDSMIVDEWSVKGSVIELSFTGGYTTYDVSVSVGGVRLEPMTNGSIGTYNLISDGIVFVDVMPLPRDNSDFNIQVVFDAADGVFVSGSNLFVLTVPRGMSILDSEIPQLSNGLSDPIWMCAGSEYDFDSPVTSPLTLTAKWNSRDPVIIVVDTDGGEVSISTGDKQLHSGDSVPVGTTIVINAIPAVNHEFGSWEIRGDPTIESSSEKTLELVISSDITVEASFRYYQSSIALPSITDSKEAPTYWDLSSGTKLSLQWVIGGDVDTSMTTWTGGVSVPLIVDDYVYVRQADKIYKIESGTGYVVDSVDSKTVTGFYHSLGYGGGLIVDTQTQSVFNLDLDRIFILDRPVGSVYYNDGLFYSIVDGKIYCFDSKDPDADRSDDVKTMTLFSTLPNGQFGSYGTFAEPLFIDGVMYCLVASGSNRSIVAISLEDGKVGVIELKGLENHLFDDGWMTFYKGRIYFTSYTVGLFGDRAAPGDACISSISISGLEMGDLKIKSVPNITSILSKFVIYEGYGYLNACTDTAGKFFVYAVSDNGDLEEVCSTSSVRSHGSIVVNTSDYSDDGRITIYLLPYANSGILYTFGHDISNNNVAMKSYDYASTGAPKQYCSQAVRIGLDGQLIWYNDSGQLMSFVKSDENEYYFFVDDGKGAVWYSASGSSAKDALLSLDDSIVTLNDSAEISSVNGVDVRDWSIYAVKESIQKTGDLDNGYIKLSNLYDRSYDIYHYYIISPQQPPEKGSQFTYLDGSEIHTYRFQGNVGSNVFGQLLFSGDVEVNSIRFYDGDVEIPGSAIVGIKGEEVVGDYPTISREGYALIWVDSEGKQVTLPKSFQGDMKLYAKWVESSFKIKTSVMESGGTLFFTISSVRLSGEADIVDAHYLVIAGYDSGSFVNVFSDTFDESDDSASSMIGLSKDGLNSVTILLVSGTPTTGLFTSFGVLEYGM